MSIMHTNRSVREAGLQTLAREHGDTFIIGRLCDKLYGGDPEQMTLDALAKVLRTSEYSAWAISLMPASDHAGLRDACIKHRIDADALIGLIA